MTQWYKYPVTVPHGGNEDGIDLGTPNDTPLTALYGGKVIDARYYPWGGQVFLAVPGANFSEGFLHLDQISVQPGQTIAPGQQVGTSGGGVGDYLEKNGQVVRATSQADFGSHSSGYHMEYDLFQGQDIGTVEMAVGNPARQIDPTSVIASVATGSGPAPGAGAVPGVPGVTPLDTPGSLPSTSQILNLPTAFQIQRFMERTAVGTLGVIIMIVGVFVAANGNNQISLKNILAPKKGRA
jgi:hypothetical protein